MKCLSLFVGVGLYILSATALPGILEYKAVNFNDWSSPGPGDVRSPCPGLNSLANHNILPHNGRNYTLPLLVQGLQAGLNVGADFALAIGSAGILSNPSPNPAAPSFDLDMLDKHNFPIEHDASLSRGDFFFGDDHSFNQSYWNMVLKYIPQGSPFTIKNAAPARFNRVKQSRAVDPTFTYTPQQFVLSYGETALYLSTMGDPVTGVAPYAYVQSLFEQEKLPYELGWRPSLVPTTLASLGLMVGELNAATGEPLLEGLILSESTLKLAFSGKNPITGKSIAPS